MCVLLHFCLSWYILPCTECLQYLLLILMWIFVSSEFEWLCDISLWDVFKITRVSGVRHALILGANSTLTQPSKTCPYLEVSV